MNKIKRCNKETKKTILDLFAQHMHHSQLPLETKLAATENLTTLYKLPKLYSKYHDPGKMINK